MTIASTVRFVAHHPLNRDRPLRALARFTRFQLASRLAGGPIVHEWIGASRLLVQRGEQGLTANVYAGLHEFPDMAFLLHYLRPSDTFVDVGANRGSYTVLAAAVVGASCISFEPDVSAFARLVDNIRINNAETRVEAVNKAVAARPGTLLLSTSGDALNRVLTDTESSSDAAEADATTLDVALTARSASLLKIDVEGMEPAVLDGARRTLADESLAAAIIEMNGYAERYGRKSDEIVSMMREFGFTSAAYDPLERSITASNVANEFGNLLFVRDVEAVLDRVRGAAPIIVNGFEI